MNNKTIAALVMAGASLVMSPLLQASTVDDAALSALPSYSGSDLELTVDNSGTHWRLWSPMATQARVLIYDNGLNTAAIDTLDMKRGENGTWTASKPEKLYGKYYTFQIEHNGKWLAETPGVWAKAVSPNGARAAIIDFATTNPEGWANDRGPKINAITDAVIYEMHHIDMSGHTNSGIVNKGKFLALTEPSTTNGQGASTGIDHLKELGVTHVHILPSFDYNSVDETRLNVPQYNWGYDPVTITLPKDLIRPIPTIRQPVCER